ncbi:MAG: M1 family metallopeptidase, partial [bacterium]|nr:M1 family metallopeptidase [bacterium]
AKKEYFFVGQWFPKIGVFSDGIWNCHQYHRNSEFYSDFGVYDVKMTVPGENILGATGIEVSVTDNDDGTRTHWYHAEDVHDFAWTTSPNFVEFNGTTQGVDIRVLMQKDRAKQGQRHLSAAKVALEYFQNWYGEYHFPNLTVVDPRRGAEGSGGMEYPTLITAGTFYGIPRSLRMPETVIIHEFGHNYWYHLVASNEFEEPWLDEGITSYSECRIMDEHYGPEGSIIDLLGLKINDRQLQRMQYISMPDVDPVVKPAWEFFSFSSYAINSYQKPSLMLITLENYLGEETMNRIMRSYFERFKFKHPTTQDFIDIANEVSDQDLDWFFDQALFSRKVVDYSIHSVFSREIKPAKGYDFTLDIFQDTTAKDLEVQTDTIPNIDSLSEPVDSTADSSNINQDTKLYYSGVNIRRLGEFIFPVEIRMIFSDGDTVIEKWDGKELWIKYRYTRPSKLLSAEVDPERKIVVDVNFTNNSKFVTAKNKGVNKLFVRFMFWVQAIFEQPEILNLFSILSNIS